MFSERKIWNDGAPFEDFMGRDGAPPVARRHLAFGGGKGGSGGTTYQTQQTTIPPEVQARYNAVNQRAEQVAQQPFKPYEGQFVAPITGTQQAGINQIAAAGQGYQPYQQAATTALTGSAEAALPYYGQAGQNIGAAQAAGAPYTGAATMAGLAGAQSVNPGQLDIGRYMDPYLQSVVAPTMQGLYQQQQQQQSQLMGSQAMRGAFGGDRGSIAAANLARQQGLAAQQAQGGLLSQGYGQALQAAQQQQGVGLGAEQANRAAMQQLSPQLLQIGQQAFQQPMAAAQAQQGLGQGLLGYGQNLSQGLAGLGQQGTQTGLASGQALLGAGTLEQQTQQQLNAALYNQYQQQQGYPFQVAQFLANIAMGTGPLYGSTTSGVTGQPTPFFSDERVKEDITEIGRTHDGQKIIKFKYKGSNQPQIGLSAQDVEKHHPEAVSETPEGIKAVDYDMATEHAERAYGGGGLMPSSEGGAVHPSMAGLGFASGGTPVPGANPEVDEMLRGLAPRRAFATAGAVTPGVDAYTQQLLQSLVNPMGGTTPHGANGKLPHKPGAWSPGVAKASPLLKGSLPSLPQQQPTGLSQTIGGVKDAVGAYETGEKLYKGGEKAYNWAKKELDRQPSGVSPDGATTGGNKITRTDLPAPAQPASAAPTQTSGLGAATPTRVADAGSGLAPETAVASLDALPTEDIAGLGEGLTMFAARGGRIGYEGGGLTGSNPALPYSGGDDKSIIEDIADDPVKAQEQKIGHKLDMSDKGGGGQKKDGTGKAIGSLAGAGIGAMFGPMGMGVGSSLGGLLGGMFARGGATDIEHAKGLISRVESGGNYNAMGPLVRGDRAHGKYQVMGANIPSWTEEALGRRMTPAEFLKSPEAQERVFEHHFGKYLNQHGNLADAASMWHSGRPLAKARADGARDVNMSTEDYVAKILGGAPPAEAHMRAETPPQRSAGLAPPLHEDEAPPPRPFVDTNDDFEMFNDFELPVRFAAGGLVPRRGYEDGGVPGAAPPSEETPETIWDRLNRTVPVNLATAPRSVSSTPAPPAAAGDPLDELATDALRRERQEASAPPPSTTPAAPPQRPPAVAPQVASATTPAATTPGVAPPLKSVEVTPSKQEDAPKPGDRDFFDRAGDWAGRNQNWLLPAVSGIGKMLASPSPYLGVAIGQGLAEGAQTGLGASFKQQGLDIQGAQAAAEVSRYFTQNVQEYQDPTRGRMYWDKLSGDRLTPEEYNRRRLDFIKQFLPRFQVPGATGTSPAGGGAAAGAGAPPASGEGPVRNTGAPPASGEGPVRNTGAPPAGVPSAAPSGTPVGVPPGAPSPAGDERAADAAVARDIERPSYLRAQIADLERRRLAAQSSGNSGEAQQLQQQLNDYTGKLGLITSGTTQPSDAQGNPVTYWAANERRRVGAEAKFKEAETRAQDARKDAKLAADTSLQLGQLSANYNSVPQTGWGSPGPAADARIGLVRYLNTGLQVLGVPQSELGATSAGAEALAKDTTRLASEMTRLMGSHEAASVFNSIAAATPRLENTPQGFNRIVAGMKAALDYKKEKAAFTTAYVNKNQTIDGLDAAFQQALPTERFIAQGLVEAIPAQNREGLTRQAAVDFMKQNIDSAGAAAQVDREFGQGTAAAIRYMLKNGMLQ